MNAITSPAMAAMAAVPTALPVSWVERIFAKLTLAYGRDFLSRWEGVDLADVRADWAFELAGLHAHPEAIAYALQHLPPKAPTVMEFLGIARRAPLPTMVALPAPVADPKRVAAAMAQLASARATAAAVNHKAWAKRIVARADAGDKVNYQPLLMARQALGQET